MSSWMSESPELKGCCPPPTPTWSPCPPPPTWAELLEFPAQSAFILPWPGAQTLV